MPIQSKITSAELSADRLPPRLAATPRRERTRVTAFGGWDAFGEKPWSIAAMKNLSPHGSPALTTRPPRELLDAASGSTGGRGMVVVDKDLYLVRGGTLYRVRDALHASRNSSYIQSMGSLSDSDKSMVVFGDYLLIFPDKKYLRLSTGTLHAMDLDTGVLENVDFNGVRLTLPSEYKWSTLGFMRGDSIHIINEDDINPVPEGYYRIKDIHGNIATIYGMFSVLNHGKARIRREVPALTMADVCGNRLFGSDGTSIYIGAEGSPFAFQGTQEDGRGAAILRSNTPGEMTACISWQGYMMFFKSASICRVLGSRADSYMLNESPAPGLPPELARTLCELGGELYYHGDSGVYRYAGATQKPERIGRPYAFSAHFGVSSVGATGGDGIPTFGVGGSDGVGYYVDLVVSDGDGGSVWSRSLYLPESGAWYCETVPPVKSNVLLGGFLCTQDEEGRVWISRSDGRRMGYSIDEATRSGLIRSTVTFHADYTHEPDGYRPIALSLRASHAAGKEGELCVLASFADGRSGTDAEDPTLPEFGTTVGNASGFGVPQGRVELARFCGGMSNRLLRIPLSVPRCDHMIVALEMTGDWKVHALVFEYETLGR